MSALQQCRQLFTTDCVIRKCALIGFRSNLLAGKKMIMGIALQTLFQYHEDPAFLERQQARCCSPSFSKSKVHCLLNSSSTEESLPPICIVRLSKAYTGPSRTKDRSCSRKVWFCFIITHVHKCPASNTRNALRLNGRNSTIYPTARTCLSVIFMC